MKQLPLKITVKLTQNRDTSSLFKNDVKRLVQTIQQPSIIYRQPLVSKSTFWRVSNFKTNPKL